MSPPPIVALTQGDPAGIGPEILLQLVAGHGAGVGWQALLIAERAALEAYSASLPGAASDRFHYLTGKPSRQELSQLPAGTVAVLDPIAEDRKISPGEPSVGDAAGALTALDLGADLARLGTVDALVTAPLNKATIDRWVLPGFVGHTDYLAQGCGLERYGRDYLMAFLAPGLKVALLSTHVSLRQALDLVTAERIVEALLCWQRQAQGRIAVAGLNPHAGEGGLLGAEDDEEIVPAVARARQLGVDCSGPSSADSLFARAREGACDWVLALYHDQGLIAVKTAAFGLATNWTLGLPYLRTSVDHGTAYDIAGQGKADASSLRAVVETTLELIAARKAATKIRS
ncbi:MAG: 4-hydroxythreonine-4-phosphate dehydrogenase PdxA [Acidobacteriota bacterium]